MLYKLILIAAGGATGTLARYGTSSALKHWSERFPYGTIAVNLLGCFLIGLLQGVFADRLVREEYKLAMLVGFLGGYTTFSTYAYETTVAFQDGQFARAFTSILVQNGIGIVLVMLGYFVGVRS